VRLFAVDRRCKGPFEIAFCASLQDIELQPKAAGGRLQVSGLRLGIGIAFIDEDRREGRRGDKFVQQLLPGPSCVSATPQLKRE
jgi:hypothetical protein